MKVNTICYKLKNPIIYNKGPNYEEKAVDEFLAYYTYKNDEEAEAEAKRLNEEKSPVLWNGEHIDWTEIDYFFVNKQEEMY